MDNFQFSRDVSNGNPYDRSFIVQHWLRQAINSGDVPRARDALKLLPVDPDGSYHHEVIEVERGLRSKISTENNAGYQLCNQAESIMKGLKGTPKHSLEQINALHTALNDATNTSKKRLEVVTKLGWQKESASIKPILSRLEITTKELGEKLVLYQKVYTSRLGIVNRLWPLVVPASEDGPASGQADLSASITSVQKYGFASQILEALNDLIRLFPNDNEVGHWKNMKSRLVNRMPGLGKSKAAPGDTKMKPWIMVILGVALVGIGILAGLFIPKWISQLQLVKTPIIANTETLLPAEIVTEEITAIPTTPEPAVIVTTVDATESVTQSPEPTSTPTEVMQISYLQSNNFTMLFPEQTEEGMKFPIFPWMIVVTTEQEYPEPPTLFLQPVDPTFDTSLPISLGYEEAEGKKNPVTTSRQYPLELGWVPKIKEPPEGTSTFTYTYTRLTTDLVELPNGKYTVLIQKSQDSSIEILGKLTINDALREGLKTDGPPMVALSLYDGLDKYADLSSLTKLVDNELQVNVKTFGKASFHTINNNVLVEIEDQVNSIDIFCFVKVTMVDSSQKNTIYWGWTLCKQVENTDTEMKKYDHIPYLAPKLLSSEY